MKKRQILSLLLALVMALSLFACAKKNNAAAAPTAAPAATEAPAEPTEAPVEPTEAPAVEPTEAPAEPTEEPMQTAEEPAAEKIEAGDATASKTIRVTVAYDDVVKEYTIHTDAENLQKALLGVENLVEGTDSEYGLFITKVDGRTANDANQEWWCFTKGGEMMFTGVKDTVIADGDAYECTLTVGW